MSGIYIHIPYCHSKCHYCDFFSVPESQNINEYIKALKREYGWRANEIGTEPIQTIYIGGGTPSIMTADQLKKIFDFLPYESCREISIEVNPEDITAEMSRAIAQTPVNRVSMGIQSMNDTELIKIGRRHSALDSLKAVIHLRDAGIQNLSLDLIYGLPGQDMESWSDTLDKIIELKPEHLSAYSLMLEPGTRLWAQLQAGKIKETPQELSEKMYNHLCLTAAAHGMEHYEISNFALPGKRSVHNSNYWNLTPYLGLGAAAHSYDGKNRRFNPSNVKKYIDAAYPVCEIEDITATQRINEYLLIRLRTTEGIDLTDFSNRFGKDELEILLERAKPDIQAGRIVRYNSGLRIPESCWLVTDSVLVNLFQS